MSLKIPVWLKAVFFGFIILEAGTRIWSLLAISNLRLTPLIPWSFAAMAVILWLIWNYLNGRWPPRSTQQTRRLWMRANGLNPATRKWGRIAAGLLGLTLFQLILISTRLTDTPSGQIEMIERVSVYPAWTVLPLLIMTSIVAGVIEEIAFRGYMQKPLELAYGPAAAVLIVALFFTLIHLPNAAIAPHLLPLFFAGSIGWGILAYLTDSIVPGVVVHSLLDISAFVLVWIYLDQAKILASESVFRNGADASFMILTATTTICIFALIAAFYRLNEARKSISAGE